MRIIITLLLCVALVGCTTPQPQPESPPINADNAEAVESSESPVEPAQHEAQHEAHPTHTDFLWEVRGGVGRVYLMGTMHVVRDGYSLTPALLDIFDEMDALALEADLLNFSNMMDFFYLSSFPEGETILDHLSERGQAHLLNMIDAYGLNADYVITSRPFALSSRFIDPILAQSDFSFIGVDLMLHVLAWERDMPIHELEDFRDYIRNVNALPADSQERLMVLSITPPDDLLADLEFLYELFLSGDEELILAFIHDTMAQTMGGDGLPIEFEPIDGRYSYYLMEARDRVMADSIIGHLESGYNVFVAAGLAHFLGERSIIYFLEQAGYYVTRVNLSERALRAA